MDIGVAAMQETKAVLASNVTTADYVLVSCDSVRRYGGLLFIVQTCNHIAIVDYLIISNRVLIMRNKTYRTKTQVQRNKKNVTLLVLVKPFCVDPSHHTRVQSDIAELNM
eukprot:1985646-Amphidinium_carterae.1